MVERRSGAEKGRAWQIQEARARGELAQALTLARKLGRSGVSREADAVLREMAQDARIVLTLAKHFGGPSCDETASMAAEHARRLVRRIEELGGPTAGGTDEGETAPTERRTSQAPRVASAGPDSAALACVFGSGERRSRPHLVERNRGGRDIWWYGRLLSTHSGSSVRLSREKIRAMGRLVSGTRWAHTHVRPLLPMPVRRVLGRIRRSLAALLDAPTTEGPSEARTALRPAHIGRDAGGEPPRPGG